MRYVIALFALAFGLTEISLGQDGATRADWPYYGGTQLAWRYSALDQVNTSNVRNSRLLGFFKPATTKTDCNPRRSSSTE